MKSQYELPKNLLLELKYFCLQLGRFNHVGLTPLTTDRHTAEHTEYCVSSAALIRRVASQTCGGAIAKHMIKHVCYGVPFNHLDNPMCSEKTFFTYKKRFMFELARAMKKV